MDPGNFYEVIYLKDSLDGIIGPIIRLIVPIITTSEYLNNANHRVTQLTSALSMHHL